MLCVLSLFCHEIYVGNGINLSHEFSIPQPQYSEGEWKNFFQIHWRSFFSSLRLHLIHFRHLIDGLARVRLNWKPIIHWLYYSAQKNKTAQ